MKNRITKEDFLNIMKAQDNDNMSIKNQNIKQTLEEIDI